MSSASSFHYKRWSHTLKIMLNYKILSHNSCMLVFFILVCSWYDIFWVDLIKQVSLTSKSTLKSAEFKYYWLTILVCSLRSLNLMNKNSRYFLQLSQLILSTFIFLLIESSHTYTFKCDFEQSRIHLRIKFCRGRKKLACKN